MMRGAALLSGARLWLGRLAGQQQWPLGAMCKGCKGCKLPPWTLAAWPLPGPRCSRLSFGRPQGARMHAVSAPCNHSLHAWLRSQADRHRSPVATSSIASLQVSQGSSTLCMSWPCQAAAVGVSAARARAGRSSRHWQHLPLMSCASWPQR
jgi:hypothetical protein